MMMMTSLPYEPLKVAKLTAPRRHVGQRRQRKREPYLMTAMMKTQCPSVMMSGTCRPGIKREGDKSGFVEKGKLYVKRASVTGHIIIIVYWNIL